MNGPALAMLAGVAEAVLGYPAPLYRRIGHPVSWMGRLIDLLDRSWNREGIADDARRGLGLLLLVVVCGVAALVGWGLQALLDDGWLGQVVLVVLASTLLAQRSLHAHVRDVMRPLAAGDLEGARGAVARIVGRDVRAADEPAVARAAIESLAENFSDGVVAPLFWGALLGLPGMAAYKALNTLDSMVGHRTQRHLLFGWASARLDDLANWVPARLAAVLIAAAATGRTRDVLAAVRRDAKRHRSPNAGCPEAAMARALGVRLSGPRLYGGVANDEPWLNDGARDPGARDIGAALELYVRACVLALLALGVLAVLW